MAGVSTPELAAAVCEAGGLGGISIGHLSTEGARTAIQRTQAHTARAFNVNLFCHAEPMRDAVGEEKWLEALRPHFEQLRAAPPVQLEPAYPTLGEESLRLLLELRPAVVSFHFGLPGPAFVNALKEAGIVLLASATCLSEALSCEAAGVDAVVAQGYEAGGHRGCFDPDAPDEQLSTAALLQVLRNRVNLPLIAAGGIMDALGVQAALKLGAAAVQAGTAFIACPESSAEQAHRRLLLHNPPPTVMTRSISGRPARGFRNHWMTVPEAFRPAYPVAYSAAKALHTAAGKRGEHGYGAQWAGQGAPLARALPAAAMTRSLAGLL